MQGVNFKIGDYKPSGKVYLAPMAGYTDLAYRVLVSKMGCSLLFSEMINSKALSFEDEKTNSMIKIDENENDCAIQIFGHEPEYIKRACEILNESICKIIDINMGCPAPKVVKNNDGSALMKDPKQVEKVIKAACEGSNKPVTVKIRKGWDEKSINAVEIAKIAEASGAKAITVHGRTREQYYSGKADWDIIKEVKKNVKIPVIGNGDVFNYLDAKALFEYTGCDGIMIGRGAQGNPFIFSQIEYYLKHNKEPKEISEVKKIQTAIKHLNLAVKYKGERAGVVEMRKHLACYLKGLKNSSLVKNEIFRIDSLQLVIDKLNNYKRQFE